MKRRVQTLDKSPHSTTVQGMSQYYKIYLLTNIVQRDYIANDVKSLDEELYMCLVYMAM